MLQPIVIVREGTPGVVRRVDKHALHLARKLLLQRLQRQQVIPENQPVVEDVTLRNALLGVIRLLGILKQNARLQLGTLPLPDPGQFEFLLAHKKPMHLSFLRI